MRFNCSRFFLPTNASYFLIVYAWMFLLLSTDCLIRLFIEFTLFGCKRHNLTFYFESSRRRRALNIFLKGDRVWMKSIRLSKVTKCVAWYSIWQYEIEVGAISSIPSGVDTEIPENTSTFTYVCQWTLIGHCKHYCIPLFSCALSFWAERRLTLSFFLIF